MDVWHVPVPAPDVQATTNNEKVYGTPSGRESESNVTDFEPGPDGFTHDIHGNPGIRTTHGNPGTRTARTSREVARQLEPLLIEPARRLRAGKVVAFPTETVYGLGANAWDESAVQKVFQAKGRPSDNPLIVHIADESQLADVVYDPHAIPEPALRLMEVFWPGPLTLILPAHPKLAPSVHPGMDTVGVRMPDHPVALALIAAAGCPVAAPSANSSGRPSPTVADAVLHDLDGRIDGLVDGGPCIVGLESTVVAVNHQEGVVYRPGWITPEELAEVSGVPFRLDPHLQGEGEAEGEKPRSPGMKYRHYAPDAQVYVWWGNASSVREAVEQFVGQRGEERMALLCPADFGDVEGVSAVWSPSADEPYEVGLGRELYQRLRWCDDIHAQAVLIIGVEPTGRGLALMNRLQKASEGRLYRV